MTSEDHKGRGRRDYNFIYYRSPFITLSSAVPRRTCIKHRTDIAVTLYIQLYSSETLIAKKKERKKTILEQESVKTSMS